MTQKSYARQMRDKQKKDAQEQLIDNCCWDELNKIYESSRVMLYQHTMIHTLAGNKDLLTLLQNPSDTAASIKILARDIKDLNDRLQQIHSLHQDKVGGSQDPDEVMRSITIAQDYSQLVDQHTAVVQPTAFKILEDFQYAENKLHELAIAKQTMAEKSPADIVDVEVTKH